MEDALLEGQEKQISTIEINADEGRNAIDHESRPKHGAYWRKTVRAGCGTVALALAANLAVFGWVKSRYDVQDGVASVYRGTCKEMNTVCRWRLHLDEPLVTYRVFFYSHLDASSDQHPQHSPTGY